MGNTFRHSRLDGLENAAAICGVRRAVRWCKRGAVLDAVRANVLEPNLNQIEAIASVSVFGPIVLVLR